MLRKMVTSHPPTSWKPRGLSSRAVALAEKVARAQAKSEEVQAIARERAATFASAAAGQSAAQLRARLPGNAQVAKAEGSLCDDPPASPPPDGAALCKPGEH
jgi:hypothetical protein